jgi:Flp pilus assembly protein TadG
VRSHKRGIEGERGAAAVEFALVLPLLLALVFGIIDFGWAVNRYSSLNNAMREGVRGASLGDTGTAVDTLIRNNLDAQMKPPANTTYNFAMTCKAASASAFTSCPTTLESGSTARVTVTLRAGWLTPLMSTIEPTGIGLSRTMEMRVE